jgi:hypothetical protein
MLTFVSGERNQRGFERRKENRAADRVQPAEITRRTEFVMRLLQDDPFLSSSLALNSPVADRCSPLQIAKPNIGSPRPLAAPCASRCGRARSRLGLPPCLGDDILSPLNTCFSPSRRTRELMLEWLGLLPGD